MVLAVNDLPTWSVVVEEYSLSTALVIAVGGSIVSVINEVVHPYFPVSCMTHIHVTHMHAHTYVVVRLWKSGMGCMVECHFPMV